MRAPRPRRFALAFLLGLLIGGLLPPTAHAQTPTVSTDDPWCTEQVGHERGRAHACEVRTYTLSGRDALTVDAGQNGGIRVEAWDRDEVRLRARVLGEARTASAARRLVDETEIETGGTIRPNAPRTRDEESLSVSFELMVPQRTDLDLTAHNGGVGIEGVSGELAFRTTNGGVALVDVGGDVRGETTNGGLSVELGGDTWEGRGLDVETTNGGVRLSVPEGYSAELETGTVNGRLRLDMPLRVQGDLNDRLVTTLGRGGPRLRVVTTNGGVSIGHDDHDDDHDHDHD